MHSFTAPHLVICLLIAQRGGKVSHKRSTLDQISVLQTVDCGYLIAFIVFLCMLLRASIHAHSNFLDKILSPDLQNPLLPKKSQNY